MCVCLRSSYTAAVEHLQRALDLRQSVLAGFGETAGDGRKRHESEGKKRMRRGMEGQGDGRREHARPRRMLHPARYSLRHSPLNIPSMHGILKPGCA